MGGLSGCGGRGGGGTEVVIRPEFIRREAGGAKLWMTLPLMWLPCRDSDRAAVPFRKIASFSAPPLPPPPPPPRSHTQTPAK